MRSVNVSEETKRLAKTQPNSVTREPAGTASVLDEQAVRTFVERWVEVQSAADLDAYKTMYADRFAGIKRVGRSERKFNLESWLNDRERTFRPGLKVAASDIQVRLEPPGAKVTFTQLFELGDFRDEGPKLLILSNSGGHLRITHEEMLASRVSGPAPVAGNEIMSVIRGDLIIRSLKESEHTDENLFSAPPSSCDGAWGAIYCADRPVHLKNLPKELTTLEGAAVTTFQSDGTSCIARAENIRARAFVDPYIGDIRRWAAMPENLVDRSIWSLVAHYATHFVADLSPDCPDAIWATWGGKPEAFIEPDHNPPVCRQVLEHTRRQPEFKELQERFAQLPGTERSHWYEGFDCSGYSPPGQGHGYVGLSMYGGLGCGFGGMINSLYRVTGLGEGDKITQHWASSNGSEFDAVFVLDSKIHFLSSTGDVEIIKNDTLTTMPIMSFMRLANDCPSEVGF